MKKPTLLLAIFLLLHVVSLSQDIDFKNQIITKDGILYSGEIESYSNNTLFFINNKSDTLTIPVTNILAVRGNDSRKRTWVMSFQNPAIKHNNALIWGDLTKDEILEFANDGEVIDKSYDPKWNARPAKTGGELIALSAQLRLGSLGVMTGFGILTGVGAFEDMTTEQVTGTAIGVGVIAAGLYIAGEAVQIKAGKLLHDKSLSLAPVNNGIGVAINF